MKLCPLRFLTGLALVLVSGPAFAVATALNINDRWDPNVGGDELNVYEIYNNLYGTSYTSSAELSGLELNSDIVNNGMFDFGDASITIDPIARFAGSRQRFGTYTPAGAAYPGAALNELFFANNSNTNPDRSLDIDPITFTPGSPFGLYLDPEGARADPYLWLSNPAVSPNNGDDHLIVLRTPLANTYLLLWADLNFRVRADQDYNDLVVQLSVNRNVIPEPASMLLIGMGLSTMALRKLRSRRS